MCVALLLFGGAIAAMGVRHVVAAFYVASVAMGIDFIVPEIILTALLQRIIPPDMRGRVFGTGSAVAMPTNPPGLLLAGALGQSFGPGGGLLIGGAAIIALAVLMFLFPAVRRLDHRADPPHASTGEPVREQAASSVD
jgi:MFS family permease